MEYNFEVQEDNNEYFSSSYVDDYIRRGTARALHMLDQEQELLDDLMMEQRETM